MSSIDLATLARGEIAEQFNMNFQKILDNISDPNTSANTKRKLTIEMVFTPDGDRELTGMKTNTKVTLAPTNSIETKFALNYDIKSKTTTAVEWGSGMKGQMSLDEDDEELPENVTKFKNANAQ